MINTSTIPEHPFCVFVKQISSHTLIKSILLSLQQRLKLNINVLLFCCWAAQTGAKQFNKRDIQNIIAGITPWHEQIVLALKKLRKYAQQSLDYKISQLILEKEIIANKIEQLILTETLVKTSYKRGKTEGFTNACKNIVIYCKELHYGMDQQDIEAIKQLLSLIFPGIEPKQIISYWGTSLTKARKYKLLPYSQYELDNFV